MMFNLAPLAGRGRIALAIRVRGYRLLSRTQHSRLAAPHPDPLRASFARLGPLRTGRGRRRQLSPLLLRLALWRRTPLQCRPRKSGPPESRPLQSRRRRTGLPHAGPVRGARRAGWRLDLPLPILLLSILLPIFLSVRLARRIRRTGTLRQTVLPLRQAVLPLQAGLTRRIVAQIIPVRVGLPQRALPADDLPADALGRMNLSHDALVAQRLLRRDRERRRGKTSARAGANGKTARALGEKTKPRAVAIVDLDPSNPAVGIGIKLDVDAVRIVGGCTFRHLDKAGGAANAERCGRRRYLHVAGMGDLGGDKGHGALGDVEQRGILLAAVLVDVIVDGDAGVGGEIERGGIIERDAEGRIRRRLQHVVEEDVVLRLERRRGVVAGHGRG